MLPQSVRAGVVRVSGTPLGYCVLALLPCFSLFQSTNRYVDPLVPLSRSLAGATQLLCRASIRTLNGPQWARCMLGSDLKPRSITTVTDLGCWVLLSWRRSLLRISGVHAVTRTRRWMSLLTKLLDVCWPSAPSTHVGSAPSSGFPNAIAFNGSACVACFLTLAGYAASAVCAPWRSGSYTSPLTHSRCNSTANFRATATAAVGSRTGAVPRRFLLGVYPRFPSYS